MSRLLLGIFSSCLAAFLFVSPAGSAVYTLVDPVTIDFTWNGDPLQYWSDTVVTFNPVTTAPDVADAICFSSGVSCGETDYDGYDWMIFTATVTAGSVDTFAQSFTTDGPGSPASSDHGYFFGSVDSDYAASSSSTPTSAEWEINGVLDLPAVQTTLVVFSLWAPGALPQDPTCLPFPPFTCPPDGQVVFGTEDGESAASFSSLGLITQVTVVPEPNTALLVGLGFVILGVRGRRRGA